MNNSLSISALATTFAILLGAIQAHAASRTWVGSSSTDWAGTNGFNTTPVTGDSLVFGAAGAAGTTLTNTLTSGINIAGITFNAGAPAYTMTGNTFNLTSGFTNTSSNLQTFNESTALTTAVGNTFALTNAGITISNGLNFTAGGVTTTVNGTGNTLTLGSVTLGTTGNRITQIFAGSGNVKVTGGLTSGGISTNSLTYAGTGTFTLGGTSNPASNGSSLNVSSGTLILTGTEQAGVVVSGTGVFAETNTGVIGSAGGTYGQFNQGSSGTSTLSGANTYTGVTTVKAGTLLLDFSGATTPATATNIINNAANSSGLTLGGGTLSINGGATGSTNSQRFNGTTLTTLTSSNISFTQNGATSLSATLGGLTRGAQSALDITLPTAGTVSTTSTTFASNGVLVSAAANGIAYATANGGTTWATNASGTIGALGSYQTDYTVPASNIDVAVGDTPSTAFTVNTLRFNVAGASLAAPTGTNTISTGGILVTSAGTGSSITGGNIQSGGGKELDIIDNGSLNVGSIIQDNAAASALTLSGTGTTTLSASNTFTGQTALLGGALKLSNQLALQNSTLQLNTGGALVFDQSVGGNAFTLGGLSSSVNIALLNNAGTPAPVALTVGANNSSTTYSGVLSGAGGSLIKTGTGTFVLTGASTYTGATTINAGVLNLTGSILNSAVTVGTNGQLLFTSNNNESAYVTGGIAGAGGVTFNYNNPSSIFTLNENNTYTGATSYITRGVAYAGVASVYTGGVLTSGAFGVNSALTFTASPVTNPGGETVILKGFNQQVGSLVGGEVGNGIVLNGANLTTGGDNTNATFAGQITGGLIPNAATATHYNALGSGANIGGSLIKIGAGTQSLTGSNFYTGSTLVDGGTLSVDSISNGGIATTLTAGVATGATTLSVASATGITAGQVIVGSGGIQNQTVASVSGTTVTFNNALPDQSVNSGTAVYFGTGNGLGISTNAAANLVLDGGTLQYTGAAASTDRLFTVGSNEAGGATGTLDASGTGALTFSNTGSIAYGTTGQARTLGLTGTNTGNNTLAPSIGDNGTAAVSVAKTGLGTWSLTGANTYSGGTTVSGGKLVQGAANAFGSTSGSLTVNAGGTADLGGLALGVGNLAGTGGTIQNTGAAAALTIGNGNATGGNYAGTISDGTGVLSLTKTGAGTATLSNATGNTYSGGTSETAGRLLVTNTSGSATGTGAVSVTGSTTILGGSGKISGAITLSSGGDLYSGATGNNVTGGPGTGVVNGTAGGMVLSSALNVNGGALTFALANTATSSFASPALSTSYITTTGAVNFTGTGNTVNLVDLSNGGLSLRMQQPYLLISAGSDSMFHGLVTVDSNGVVSLDGDGYVLGVSTGSGFAYTTITINQFGSDGVTPLSAANSYNSPVLYLSGGNLEVVPEPSTWALMIGGLALLVIINRRRSSN